jgi:hypothetical protein
LRFRYRLKRGRGGSKGKTGGGSSNKSGGKEHTSNARPSTQGKHEKGQARQQADQQRSNNPNKRRQKWWAKKNINSVEKYIIKNYFSFKINEKIIFFVRQ